MLLPDGLPKDDLLLHQTVERKGRCAVLKSGIEMDGLTMVWLWVPAVRVAMAADVHCYEAGKEYEHGGLSPQECVVPVLAIEAGEGGTETIAYSAAGG